MMHQTKIWIKLLIGFQLVIKFILTNQRQYPVLCDHCGIPDSLFRGFLEGNQLAVKIVRYFRLDDSANSNRLQGKQQKHQVIGG